MMLSNPDTALPLYLLVVIAGVMLGPGWRKFLAAVQQSSTTAATTAGSAATSKRAYSDG